MSAMKQGTPAWQKLSAMTCKVTVFPVPVAPATSPCLLAIFPTIERGPFSQWAIQSPRVESYISCNNYLLSFSLLSCLILRPEITAAATAKVARPIHGAVAALIPKPTLSTRMKVTLTAVMKAAGIPLMR